MIVPNLSLRATSPAAKENLALSGNSNTGLVG